jgi:hypothetical protein
LSLKLFHPIVLSSPSASLQVGTGPPPKKRVEIGTCWSVTRFKSELLGLKLCSTGTTQEPRIHCTIYSKTKMDDSSKQSILRMLKRALKVEEDLTGFYELSQNDDILRDVIKDLYGMHTIG